MNGNCFGPEDGHIERQANAMLDPEPVGGAWFADIKKAVNTELRKDGLVCYGGRVEDYYKHRRTRNENQRARRRKEKEMGK